MIWNNFRKNNHYNQKETTVNIDIKISLRNALSDEYIKNVVNKIKHETKGIPHVNVKLHIS